MARKKSTTLTEAELPIMEVLWDKGVATVGEVAEGLSKDKAVAYNTVLTLMRILERKGYVQHTKDGRAFVYQPVVDRGEASRTAVRQLLNRFFNDSPELLVLNLLHDEAIDEQEIERLRGLIGKE
ncbi:MAG TPA: BlaI/MecI/CopY family transcriptional regulator [Bryobacteraceae bacterium]|nr:BlaI/MecI/CopY family transcriptional regulator [Bryobacteraceae bacterium]